MKLKIIELLIYFLKLCIVYQFLRSLLNKSNNMKLNLSKVNKSLKASLLFVLNFVLNLYGVPYLIREKYFRVIYSKQ